MASDRARRALLDFSGKLFLEIRHGEGRDHLSNADADALIAAIVEAEDGEVEPGQLIAKVDCPCCGAALTVEHGDDEGEIGVIGEAKRGEPVEGSEQPLSSGARGASGSAPGLKASTPAPDLRKIAEEIAGELNRRGIVHDAHLEDGSAADEIERALRKGGR